MKTLLAIVIYPKFENWGLTFKDGKQVLSDNEPQAKIDNYLSNALAGYQIENESFNLSYPAICAKCC